jgi:hypothetical protein
MSAAVRVLLAAPLVVAALAALRGGGGAPLLASVLVLAAAEVLGRTLDRLGLGWVAAWALALTVYATPVIWYALEEPASGHVVLFAAGAGALALLARDPDGPSRRRDLVIGLAAGLVLATLEQAIDFAGQAATGRPPALALRPSRPFLLESLFSSRQGLFFWTPLAWVGVAGLLSLQKRHAGLTLRIATALLVLVLASGLSSPWWSGHFGNGRLVAVLALLAPGLAAALEALRRRARRAPVGVLAAAAALVVVWNLLFMQQYRRELIPRDDTVAFPVVAENAARLVSESVGSPVAWPANWLVAARHDLEVARFDRLVGLTLFTLPGNLRGVIDVGRMDTDLALLGEGWSVRHPCEDEVCRDVDGRARVFVPLDESARLELRIRAAGQGVLTVALDGATVGRPVLSPTLQLYVVRLGEAPLGRGMHAVVLQVSPEGRASVDRLIFRRTR